MRSERWGLYPWNTHQLCVRDFMIHIFPTAHPTPRHVSKNEREGQRKEGRKEGKERNVFLLFVLTIKPSGGQRLYLLAFEPSLPSSLTRQVREERLRGWPWKPEIHSQDRITLTRPFPCSPTEIPMGHAGPTPALSRGWFQIPCHHGLFVTPR